MINKPAIVISAFNRVEPLKRLLKSIENAIYESEDIQLVISIDKSDNRDVIKVSEEFVWKHGSKKIITHQKQLGLKAHILSCGELTNSYESLILLEDDLMVSPYFYVYAKQAKAFYENDSSIAGISLYNYKVAESCFYPFQAIDDGSDVYFMQVASSWGQLWTRKHWTDFVNWFSVNPELIYNDSLPRYLNHWGQHSWKKHFIHYLIDTNKYFVFPRLSLTTNFEEDGTNSTTKNIFHVPLQLLEKEYQFKTFAYSNAIYDAWFELLPKCLNQLNPKLQKYNYEVDLYGAKEIVENKSEHILTSKNAQEPVLNFGMDLFPLESNVALDIVGNSISLYKKENSVFLNKKLELRNYLQGPETVRQLSFSIIIPVIQFDEELLKKTFNSIPLKNVYVLDVIIMTYEENILPLKKICGIYNINSQFIFVPELTSLDEMVLLGFDKSKSELLTWISAGSLFKEGAIQNINSIFSTYPTISWIVGIEEDITDKWAYERLDVFKYRLVPGEIYKHLEKGYLNTSIEGHVIRRSSLLQLDLASSSFESVFFELITSFQLIIVVKCFIDTKQKIRIKRLTEMEKADLLNRYKQFEYKTTFKLQVINFFMSFPVLAEETSKWYYTSLHNFPDVLRFDFKNTRFYFSKY